jgi:transcriptional regulator
MTNISLIEKALEKTLRKSSNTIFELIEDIQDLKSIQNFEKSSRDTKPWEQAKKDLDI